MIEIWSGSQDVRRSDISDIKSFSKTLVEVQLSHSKTKLDETFDS